MSKQYLAFKTEYSGITNVLVTPGKAGLPPYMPKGGECSHRDFTLLWDTGATNSVITPKVVASLGLVPTGKITMTGVNSQTDSNTYIVDIILPNNLRVKDVVVSEGNIMGCDILIGMDIIGIGDFSIANGNNKTLFSFMFPAHHNKIDLLEKSGHINPKIKV